MRRELRVDDRKALVYKSDAPVNAIHGAAYVARACDGDEAVESDESFSFGAGSVQEGRTEDVHSLDVDAWF